MIVHLRKLTLKSRLGFGYDKDLTVSDMLITYKELDLINLYYGFGNIDFDDEVKTILCITKEREIPKPGSLRGNKLHPTLNISQVEVQILCTKDFNKNHTSRKTAIERCSYKRSFKKQDDEFRKKQWGEKEYNKGAMKYINQHGGINR